MKKLIFIAVLLCAFASATMAQKNGYQAAMSANVQKLDTAKSKSTFIGLANSFERIALKEKSEWLPYYYAAYAKVYEASQEKNKEGIDPICDQAEYYITKADSLSPHNAEIACIQSMIATARIKVDFMERGLKYIKISNDLLQNARSVDPANPRVYYLLGCNMYNTPKAFGGSKENGYQILEKAEAIFTEKQAEEKTINPHWGRGDAEKIILHYQAAAQKPEQEIKSN